VEHATLTILFARVLRPGSSPELDTYLEATVAYWRALEERTGMVVDARPFALIRARQGGLNKLLPGAPSAEDKGKLQSWNYSTLLGILWRRPSSIRREGFGLSNPFAEAPIHDRLIIRVPNDASPIVRVDSESWFDELTEALNMNGVARILSAHDKKGQLADAVRYLATHPIDTGGLHVFARLGGYARCAEGTTLAVEMPEAFQ
jgi:hypothetical protein